MACQPIDILTDIIDTGVYFLSEEPLCTTVEDCRTLVDAADGYDGVVWMGMEYRYKPPITRLIEEVKAGAVGTVHMVAIREHRFPLLDKVGVWNRFNRNIGKVEAFVPESIVRVGSRTVDAMVETQVQDNLIAFEGLLEGASYLEHIDFRDAITAGLPPKVALADGMLAVAIGVAAHRSIDEGRPVILDEVMGSRSVDQCWELSATSHQQDPDQPPRTDC